MDTEFPFSLYHNDLSTLTPGPQHSAGRIAAPEFGEDLIIPVPASGAFRVIERGLGKYIETIGGFSSINRLIVCGDRSWTNYRVRVVVTPLDFENASPGGALCGIIARYTDPENYMAVVLSIDYQVRLLQRRAGVFEQLDAKPLEYCLGQSLTLAMTFEGDKVTGMAGPYAGATFVRGTTTLPSGKVGFISDVRTRLGPINVECKEDEARRMGLV